MGKEMMMIISLALHLLLTLFIFDINLASSSGSIPSATGGGGDCSGEKVGECSPEAEMEMDSETNRRVMWAASGSGVGTQKRYISYEALRRDNVPCNRPGIPYYNCHALPKANPYTRGCTVITGCARGD